MGVARVVLSSGFSRRYTGGKREFDIEAKSLRDIIKALDQLYPGLGEHLEEETTVAIDGESTTRAAISSASGRAARSSSSRSSKAADPPRPGRQIIALAGLGPAIHETLREGPRFWAKRLSGPHRPSICLAAWPGPCIMHRHGRRVLLLDGYDPQGFYCEMQR